MRLRYTCESEQRKSAGRGEEEEREQKEEKKNERGTGRRKMKRASHGASGGALWNAASKGRMKALVTSHCTNVHTRRRTHAHAHNLTVVQQRRTVPLS